MEASVNDLTCPAAFFMAGEDTKFLISRGNAVEDGFNHRHRDAMRLPTSSPHSIVDPAVSFCPTLHCHETDMTWSSNLGLFTHLPAFSNAYPATVGLDTVFSQVFDFSACHSRYLGSVPCTRNKLSAFSHVGLFLSFESVSRRIFQMQLRNLPFLSGLSQQESWCQRTCTKYNDCTK